MRERRTTPGRALALGLLALCTGTLAVADDGEASLAGRLAALERSVAALNARLERLEGALTASARGAPARWKDSARWAELRAGMSRYQVWELLGEPGKASRYEGFERWEYPDLLGGHVNFDDEGRVSGWRRP